jgi:PAS domain S-box-containing protein
MPDLIISDALMPIMDGFQFLRNIKKDETMSSIPFIFYSAVYRGQKDIELALSIGAEAYIVKPKDPEEFWKELNVIIEKGFSKKVPPIELIKEEEEYLRKYSYIVAFKLLEKVRELDQTIKQLRDSKERCKAITGKAAIGIALVNLEKRPVESNPALQKMLGYSNKELCSMHLSDFTYPDDVESDVKLTQELFEGERNQYQIEKRYIRKDGLLVWGNLVTSIIRDAKGKPQYSVNMIEDITERKRAEEELAKHRDHLEELVKERTAQLEATQEELIKKERLAVLGKLTASVAHELRNPLGTISTSLFYIGEMVGQNQTEAVANTFKRAERGILRCDRIIDELLSFTRAKKLNQQVTDIDHWLNNILEEHGMPENIEYTYKIDSGTKVIIEPEHFRRAIINVLDNAIQALGDKKSHGNKLKVETEVINKKLEIRFIDTGVGIPDDQLEKVFEPLFSTKGFGIGLGIPIVKDIMETHGGGIEYHSKVGKGTTVVLWLPLPKEERI